LFKYTDLNCCQKKQVLNMLIGVPKEIKNNEFRVGLIPAVVRELVQHGHKVVVESSAGIGIGTEDSDYQSAGAQILDSAIEVFESAEMIVKVKEPQSNERRMLRKDQTLFTYLHLAPDYEQTLELVESQAVCIAYETVTDGKGHLPLLAPMSEVAGRMSVQAGARCLEKENGGSGVLLGGVPGVAPAKVLILGGGVVGSNAAQMAIGMGAQVTILDKSLDVLRHLDLQYGNRLQTVYSTRDAVEKYALDADLIIGGVLIPGASAPKLITAEMIKGMRNGSAVVDVAIDQGGCFETSHATTHEDPTYIVDGIVHYCVANMPGAVARTSTYALNHATLPYVIELADKGIREALLSNHHLMNGLNICNGQVTNESVAEALNFDYVSPEAALGF
jgi:alanine dehydrogenase